MNLDTAPGYGGGHRLPDHPWLRVDATVDQSLGARYRAYSSGSASPPATNVEAGDIDVLTGLVTAYADLGTWWGLTPYLGAGVGFADAGLHRGLHADHLPRRVLRQQSGHGPARGRPPPEPLRHLARLDLTGGVAYASAPRPQPRHELPLRRSRPRQDRIGRLRLRFAPQGFWPPTRSGRPALTASRTGPGPMAACRSRAGNRNPTSRGCQGWSPSYRASTRLRARPRRACLRLRAFKPSTNHLDRCTATDR